MIIFDAIKKSISPAIKTTTWLLKIMLPVTLVVTVFEYLGWIAIFSEFATPLFKIIGLEGKSAIPFITAVLTNIYAGIAVMASLDLDYRTVTILAVMCLIAHNMIVECKIQQKAGSPILIIAPLRIVVALLAGFVLNKVIEPDMSGQLYMPIAKEAYNNIFDAIKGWSIGSAKMSAQIIIIVFCLNIVQYLLKVLNIIELLQRPLAPLMTILGLPKSTSILWIIANTLGLAYGGIAIVNELEKGDVKSEDVRLMNTSIAITHSLLEDSLLFIAIGVGVFWVIVPRLVLSIIIVHGQRLLRRYTKLKY